jgi:hypothetical protein
MGQIFSRIRRSLAIYIAIVILASFFIKASLGGSDKESDIEPGAVIESKSAVAVAWRSADKSNTWMEDRRRTPSSMYSPNVPLVSQLEKLRSLSDRSNPYATCVLAWALDLCSRGPALIPVGKYSNADLTTLDEESVTKIAESMESHERYEFICSGLVKEDLEDMDARLLQAARMGHVRSMVKLAQFPARPGSGIENSTQSFLVAHRKNAELFLNKAAEAGDPDAIRGIYNAYSAGYISSDMGDVEVVIDMAKSLAALRVISNDASPQEKIDVDLGIADSLMQMDRAQRSRFDHYESLYRQAYAKVPKNGAGFRSAIDDLPELACKDGFIPSGR